jgi:[ribosomal protein S5]-alanine N-acetyltransferase
MEQPVYHRLSARCFIGPVIPDDKPAYIEHFKDRRIYENTANIPYPYTEADADWWIAYRGSRSANSKETLFAIRNPDGLLVGSVDAGSKTVVGSDHASEICYWLAVPY